jgi:hypothetical protein
MVDALSLGQSALMTYPDEETVLGGVRQSDP